MAIPIRVPLDAIATPGHLSMHVFKDPTSSTRTRLEIYTGWIDMSFDRIGKHLDVFSFQTFLPVSRNRLKFYNDEDDLLEHAISASASAIIDEDDELNMLGVSNGRAEIFQKDDFKGVGKSQWALRLNLDIVGAKVNIRGITYHVSLFTKDLFNDQNSIIPNPIRVIDGSEIPAGVILP
jgi:hypothetical protein